MLEDAGRMDEAEEAQRNAEDAARRFNSRSEVIWSLSASAFHCMTRGDWDEAFRRHDEALAGAAQMGGHYQEATMLIECAWMRMARDEVDRARTDAARALAIFERIEEPQGIIPVLASAMAIHVELDELDQARAVLGRLARFQAAARGGWRFAGGAVVVDAAMRLGLGQELIASHVDFAETRWLVAAKAFLRGDFDAAAATYASMPAALDASIVRLHQAHALAAAGRARRGRHRVTAGRRVLPPYRRDRLLERAARIGPIRRREAELQRTEAGPGEGERSASSAIAAASAVDRLEQLDRERRVADPPGAAQQAVDQQGALPAQPVAVVAVDEAAAVVMRQQEVVVFRQEARRGGRVLRGRGASGRSNSSRPCSSRNVRSLGRRRSKTSRRPVNHDQVRASAGEAGPKAAR